MNFQWEIWIKNGFATMLDGKKGEDCWKLLFIKTHTLENFVAVFMGYPPVK